MRANTSQIRVLDGQNRDNSDKSIIQSVEKEGVLVPLLVYSDPDNVGSYILVAGHRRLASAIHFKLKDVPVEVIPQDQAEKARALENLDRKGLHPLDEATEITTLQSQGYDNSVISAMLGMPLAKVIRRAKLNNLSPTVRQAFVEGAIQADSAEEYSIMEPELQDEIYGRLKGVWNCQARQVRSAYLDIQGLAIKECSKAILEDGNPCATCPNNVASDNILFDESQGCCRDSKCYVTKLKKLMFKEGVNSVWFRKYGSDDKMVKALKKAKVEVVEESNYWSFEKKKSDTYSIKKMDIYGNITWAEKKQTKPKEDPTVAKRKKELSKRYTELFKALPDQLEKMVAEHADAYMAKYHKDERFPDKDERVILARYIYSEGGWRMTGFIRGLQDYETDPLKGADNKRLLATVIFYSTLHENNEQIWPKKIDQGGKLLLPKSMDIEDMYQLKTSKAKKKVMEIKTEMEQLLEEYHKLEG